MATLEAEVDWKTSYYALDRLYEKREAERDEARTEAAEWNRLYTQMQDECVAWREKAQNCTIERDEALEKLDATIEQSCHWASRSATLLAERDEALEQSTRAVNEAEEWERLYDQMKAERDEALRQLEAERGHAECWHNAYVAEADKAEQMRTERDEVRATAAKLQEFGLKMHGQRDEAREWARKLYAQCKAANKVVGKAYAFPCFDLWEEPADQSELELLCNEYYAVRDGET